MRAHGLVLAFAVLSTTVAGVTQNSRQDCWDGCGKKGGFCSWCGTGVCCRRDHSADPPVCLGADTSDGGWFGIGDHHECLDPPQVAANCFNEKVFITSHRNQQLQDASGMVELSSNKEGWEQWIISDAKDGKVFITSHRGRRLEDLERYGPVMSQINGGEFEKWTISDGFPGRVYISSRNKHLGVTGHKVGLRTTASGVAAWTITTTSGQLCTSSSFPKACEAIVVAGVPWAQSSCNGLFSLTTQSISGHPVYSDYDAMRYWYWTSGYGWQCGDLVNTGNWAHAPHSAPTLPLTDVFIAKYWDGSWKDANVRLTCQTTTTTTQASAPMTATTTTQASAPMTAAATYAYAPAPPPAGSSGLAAGTVALIVGGSIVGVCLCLCLCAALAYFGNKKKTKASKEKKKPSTEEGKQEEEEVPAPVEDNEDQDESSTKPGDETSTRTAPSSSVDLESAIRLF